MSQKNSANFETTVPGSGPNLRNASSVAHQELFSADRNYTQIGKEALTIIFGVNKFEKYLMERHFTIYTDHKPLVKLFDSQQATSATGAARINRWSHYLSNFNYQVEYRKGCDNSNADALSRLPLSSTESTLEELSNVQPVQISLIESTPIDSKQCKMAILRNPIYSKVLNFVHRGWPDKRPSEELCPYHLRREELIIEDNILLWELRVFVPRTLRLTMLNLLHFTHIGVVRMKGL